MITRIDKQRKLNDMSPKEKAFELAIKFEKELSSYSMSVAHRKQYAKQCAIICCDEILESFEKYLNRPLDGVSINLLSGQL